VASVSAVTVRDWATTASSAPEDLAVDPLSVTIVRVDASALQRERAGGAAFGALVHAVLAQAPFDASNDQLRALAEVEGRLLGIDDETAAAAALVVQRVFQHDLMIRARRADARGNCRRETPVTVTLEDGTTVEGIVDLAFEEDGRWQVVDYKTDRDLAARGEEHYRRQVAMYTAAVRKATGQTAAGVLVRV
jgi:ATP-dependent helicase/nuclease subunit A